MRKVILTLMILSVLGSCQYKDMEQEVENLRKELLEKESKIEELEREISEKEDKINYLKNEVDNLESEVDDLERRLRWCE